MDTNTNQLVNDLVNYIQNVTGICTGSLKMLNQWLWLIQLTISPTILFS